MSTNPAPLPTEAEVAEWRRDTPKSMAVAMFDRERLLALVEAVMPIVESAARSGTCDFYGDDEIRMARDLWRRWRGEA